MTQQQQEMFSQLLGFSVKEVETLEIVALTMGYDNLAQFLRCSLANLVDWVMNFRDRRRLRRLHEAIEVIMKEMTRRN